MSSGSTIEAAATLAAVRRARAEADAAEGQILVGVVTWAEQHMTDHPDTAACWGDTPVLLAGEGAPMVTEFCVAELAAALRISTDAGRFLIGQAVEIAYRLPKIWARVRTGELQVWRARRIAEKTIPLSIPAAAFVDDQIAGFAHKIGNAATERLIDEAIARFMPGTATEIAQKAADGRKVEINHRQPSFSGTSTIYGELDLADAIDLDARLSADASALKDWGSEESLDVRRSIALGNLARGEVPLPNCEVSTGSTNGGSTRPGRATRSLTLYLHLDPRDPFGRIENTNRLISVEQIREWLDSPGAQVTVKPVINLNEEITCTGYEPSDRLREQLVLRDRMCIFPWCTRPARRCDADHIRSYDPDGPEDQTSTSKLGLLCRFHHRLKTFGGWTYLRAGPGAYRWLSPAGYEYLRDQSGTRDLTPRPVDPPG